MYAKIKRCKMRLFWGTIAGMKLMYAKIKRYKMRLFYGTIAVSLIVCMCFFFVPHMVLQHHLRNITPWSWPEKAKHIDLIPRISKYQVLNGSANIELVVRLTLKEKFIKRLYCDVLRSSAIFWNSTLLGGYLLILDESDREKAPDFIQDLASIPNMPHTFRVQYEKLPTNTKPYEVFAESIGRPIGYGYQLYSSFLMDLYTDKPILAWIDTDVAFVTPVLPENIMNTKGQLIVKGWNSLDWPQNQGWRRATQEALGVSMVSDFMTYFPMFIYTRTIRNCRNHIMKHLNASTFEEAFSILISRNFVSPCDVLMTYAYYFEYDSYEWHIDIRHEQLEAYNTKYCPSKPLGLDDLTPAIHLAAHSAYSESPLERAICNMNYYNGLELTTNCKKIFIKNKLQLFQFEKRVTHFDTWCKAGNFDCQSLVEVQYIKFWQERKEGIKNYHPGIIRDIENSFYDNFGMQCSKIDEVLVTSTSSLNS